MELLIPIEKIQSALYNAANEKIKRLYEDEKDFKPIEVYFCELNTTKNELKYYDSNIRNNWVSAYCQNDLEIILNTIIDLQNIDTQTLEFYKTVQEYIDGEIKYFIVYIYDNSNSYLSVMSYTCESSD